MPSVGQQNVKPRCPVSPIRTAMWLAGCATPTDSLCRLPLIGRVPIPRPDQLAFYGALAALVAVELVDWPVAVAIGAGHALISGRSPGPEKDRPADRTP